jgi:hypothetical protein
MRGGALSNTQSCVSESVCQSPTCRASEVDLDRKVDHPPSPLALCTTELNGIAHCNCHRLSVLELHATKVQRVNLVFVIPLNSVRSARRVRVEARWRGQVGCTRACARARVCVCVRVCRCLRCNIRKLASGSLNRRRQGRTHSEYARPCGVSQKRVREHCTVRTTGQREGGWLPSRCYFGGPSSVTCAMGGIGLPPTHI